MTRGGGGGGGEIVRIFGNVLGEAKQFKNAENLAYVNASFVRYQIPSCTMHAEVIS